MNLTYSPFLRDSESGVLPSGMDLGGYRPRYTSSSSTEDGVVDIPSSVPAEDISSTSTAAISTDGSSFIPSQLSGSATSSSGFDSFSNAFKSSGIDSSKFDFYSKLAEKESGFNPSIQNSYGAPAYGYFQFMEGKSGKRSWDNISRFAGVSVDEFRKSPELQIKAADKLATSFLSGFSDKDKAKAKELGYSDSALVAGAWLGGVGGVRKLLHEGKSVNDYSWSKDKKTGADMLGRMKEFNNLFKGGGILKRQDGGVLEGKKWVNNWYSNRRSQIKKNMDSDLPFFLPSSGTLGYKLLAKNMDLADYEINPSKLEDDANGYYSIDRGNIVLRDDNPSTAVHEWTHSSQPAFQLTEIKKIKDRFGELVFDSPDIEEDAYLDSPEEIYSRLMQMRHGLNIDPSHVFTREEVDKLKDSYVKKTELYTDYTDGDKKYRTRTVFDKDNNIKEVNPLKEGFTFDINDSKVFKTYDNRDNFEILDRYSTDFVTRLLNDVAKKDVKDTRDVISARLGLKIPKFQNPAGVLENSATKRWREDKSGEYSWDKRNNRPYPEFWDRLRDKNKESIYNWEGHDLGSKATHKLGWGEVDDKVIVYPEVQKVGDKLVDFTRPPYHSYAGIDNALDSGNYAVAPSRNIADNFTKTYKQKFSGFGDNGVFSSERPPKFSAYSLLKK